MRQRRKGPKMCENTKNKNQNPKSIEGGKPSVVFTTQRVIVTQLCRFEAGRIILSSAFHKSL